MDYSKLLAEHVENAADMTVACLEIPLEEASAFGVMGVNNEWQVTSFAEKPNSPAPIPGQAEKALASMGIYVFKASFLYEQLIRDHDVNDSSHDFGKDLIPFMVPRYRVFAHRF